MEIGAEDAYFSHLSGRDLGSWALFVGRLGGDQGANFFAADDADDIAGFAHAEDHHGHVVVFTEGDGGGVHDAEVEAKDVRVGDLFEFCGFVVDLWGRRCRCRRRRWL